MTTQEVYANEEKLRQVLLSDRFLNMQGLAGEIPHYVYPFKPEDAVQVEKSVQRLINFVRSEGVGITEINLYDLAIDLIKARGLWNRIIAIEPQEDKERFLRGLRNLLSAQKHLAPAIEARLAANPGDIVFLTGIGEVFPFIRSHNVLANLETIVTDRPLVAVFPGQFNQDNVAGSSLVLFNRLKGDQYYRARNILDQEV